ncbi:uncharacterized protein LOC143296322 [Babylonia areolata]|uniref:uncharacterized protein LOC143296322 n=1 Tax=Babylonia areolata TaxID=304850 RepID=UPI003FD3A919
MSAATPKLVVKMWGLLFVICTLLPSLMCKEHMPKLDLDDEEKFLISKIIKRLEKKSETNLSKKTVQDGMCDMTKNDGKIIRSNESIHNGAQFLRIFKEDASNNISCADHCCKNPSCDTAVFENKGEHKCFLFQCQGKCKFSDHGNFVTLEISRSAPSSTTNNKDPIDPDLDPAAYNNDPNDYYDWRDDDSSSNKGGSAVDSSAESATARKEDESTTSTPNSTTNAAAVAVTYILPHSVMLGGTCHRDLHCQDPMAQCNFHQCLCQQGFQQSDTVCRKPLGGDSSSHSDEDKEEEEKTDKPVKETQGQHDSEHSSEEENQLNAGEDNQEGNQPSSTGETSKEESEADSDSSSSKQESQEEGPTSSEAGGEHPDPDSTLPVAEKTNNGAVDTSTASSSDPTTVHGGFISREKIAEVLAEENLNVPIIALSVGLAFTLILLVFVACRLCRVRRQLRKGRPLHSHEADYLINGMYL